MKDFNYLSAKIDDHISTGLGRNLSTSWEDFKRQAGPYIGFFFVSLIITMAASLIPLIGSFSGIFLAPLTIGFAAFVHEDRKNQSQGFNDFFKPFQKFSPILLTALLVGVLFLIALLPLIFGGLLTFIKEVGFNPRRFSYSDYRPEFPAGFLVTGLISIPILIYVGIITFFATMFAYFYDVQPIEALKLSFKMGNKNFLHIICYSLLSAFLGFVGAIPCFLGLIITVPLIAILKYHSFAAITDLEQDIEPQFDFENR